jgi:hypothetical protein
MSQAQGESDPIAGFYAGGRSPMQASARQARLAIAQGQTTSVVRRGRGLARVPPLPFSNWLERSDRERTVPPGLYQSEQTRLLAALT